MSNDISVITIAELLSLNWPGTIECTDHIDQAPKEVYSIGGIYIPDHYLTCYIPKKMHSLCNYKKVIVEIHIIWLYTDSTFHYSGLVADKKDGNLYFASIYPDDADSKGFCSFEKVTADDILVYASNHNAYLRNVAELSIHQPEKLLEYQIYAPFSDRFYYMEMDHGDKVVMCSVGLHSNKLLAVGWLGKLINKDCYIAYAECTPEVYDQIQAQYPSLYDRGQLIEKNKSLFSHFQVSFEKRKHYSDLVDILLQFQKEPFGAGNVACFHASPRGTTMVEYNGPAYSWMEAFIRKYRENYRNMA